MDKDPRGLFLIFALFFLVLGVVSSIELYTKYQIEKEAIKAGLHQEFLNGRMVWVK